MSKKLNAGGGFKLGLVLGPEIEALAKYPDLLRSVHERIHEIEAAKVATYNRLMVPVAKPGEVTDAEAEEAAKKMWGKDGQGDASV